MATATMKATAKDTLEGTARDSGPSIQRLIDGLQKNEQSALDAMKRFVDAVNDAFPDIGEDGPRHQIIEAAFAMTEQVVEASNRLATSLVDAVEGTVQNVTRSAS